MDRVGGVPSQPFVPRRETAKGGKAKSPESPGFLGFLKRTQEQAVESEGIAVPTDAEVETLLDEVYASGQELARNPSPENVVAYKKAVGRFIRQVVDAVELVETEGRIRKDMKKPKYAVLHVVDEKLAKLGAYVLSNQRDKLEILRKVDELHGLLVDLRH